jgi:hypothetical protein
MSWNKILLEAVTFGLNEIPVVGSLLGHIAAALWPESKEDIWGEIKDKVEGLVNKKITTEVYNRVSISLGDRQEMDGLIGIIQNYLLAVKGESDLERARSVWDAANAIFIQMGSEFKESGHKILLLPLFAQFANLHLSLLRDGVLHQWISADNLQSRIDVYTRYVDEQYQEDLDKYIEQHKGDYNSINKYRREWTFDLLNFRDAWQYYNPSTYAPPVKISSERDIYYTLGEHYDGNTKISYSAPGKIDRNLKELQLVWLEQPKEGYNFVQGFISTYDSGTTEYEGALWDDKMPKLSKECDPKYDTFCFFKKDIHIKADNPIVAVQAEYEKNGAVYSMSFGFKDKKWTGYIPKPAEMSNPDHIVIRPPEGYYLTSIWAPNDRSRFYNGVVDVVFGFSLNPKLLTTL